MKHADFAIGTEFEISAGQRWRCTDVGQRTITAIELDPELDEAWFNGPPFAVPEVVFDEIEMENAYRSLDEAFRNRMAEIDSLPHPGFPHEVISTIITAQLSDASRGYPSGRLLRFDRVDITGEILHPYAAEPTGDGWRILLYAPFTQTFGALPETEFVRLRPAASSDLEARKQAFGTMAPGRWESNGAQVRGNARLRRHEVAEHSSMLEEPVPRRRQPW